MLDIILEPNPGLHRKVSTVKDINEDTVKLVAQMQTTMHNANGIGLAAPQVNINQQIAIVQIGNDENPGELIAMINPKITNVSSNIVIETEGCLSIPHIEVDVARPEKITVKYTNLKNNQVSLDATGLLARAIQHEIDHLNGILITDHGPARMIKEND